MNWIGSLYNSPGTYAASVLEGGFLARRKAGVSAATILVVIGAGQAKSARWHLFATCWRWGKTVSY